MSAAAGPQAVGAFIDEIRADTPTAARETPPATAKSQAVETRTFPLIVEQVGTVQTRTQAQVAGHAEPPETENRLISESLYDKPSAPQSGLVYPILDGHQAAWP